MRKNLLIARNALLWFLLLIFLYLGAVLTYGTLTDFQPQAENSIPLDHPSNQPIIEDSILSFTIWNLGYGGLGQESEFFYDSGNLLFSGGKMVRTTRKNVEKNNEGILNFVRNIQSDFFLFQEVDSSSKRSYYANQYQDIAGLLPDYAATFATNYKSNWVPIPVFEPWQAYGSTNSGLATYSRYEPKAVTRLQLPGTFPWPTRIFQLDRCVAVSRFATANGKELVVMNIHNSAYDKGGFIKQQQMVFLHDLFLAEYQKGNYVVIGGDWNQCPPNFRFDGFMPGKTQGYTQINIDPEYLPQDWLWAYDTRVPTNRKIRTPFKAGETFVTLIDFFLVSPNVRVRQVKNIDQQFQFSDHHPVWMEVELLD